MPRKDPVLERAREENARLDKEIKAFERRMRKGLKEQEKEAAAKEEAKGEEKFQKEEAKRLKNHLELEDLYAKTDNFWTKQVLQAEIREKAEEECEREAEEDWIAENAKYLKTCVDCGEDFYHKRKHRTICNECLINQQETERIRE